MPAAYCIINRELVAKAIKDGGFLKWWLCEQVGVAHGTLTRWLSGKIEVVEIEKAKKLYEALEITEPILLAIPANRRLDRPRLRALSQKRDHEGKFLSESSPQTLQ